MDAGKINACLVLALENCLLNFADERYKKIELCGLILLVWVPILVFSCLPSI